jgi:GTP-binding protein
LGTVVRDSKTNNILKDLVSEGEQFIVARGGRGGRGNASFKSSINQAPRISQEGQPGETVWLKLELKLLADVGIIGLPNAGKSTLISKISSAHPKIADYPFTTLTPNLGVVQGEHSENFVVADIPGLIEGAHSGSGLGLKFLKHIERTSLLIFLLDASHLDENDPGRDYTIILSELENYNPALMKKPRIIALNKVDLLSQPALPENIKSFYKKLSFPCVALSALTGDGIKKLLTLTKSTLKQTT